ncbi:MAG TPA: DNA-directed RNA polymerase subunit K [Candidatus Thermoplasmatota archaeon]|nr:DNA-directed RNA polymerase subunit K [Candidatus Thermoplasmatota archaeon]
MVQVQPHTRFEKARIIGARALQIGMGAPVVLHEMSTLDPVLVAEEEYRANVIPITVAKRGARVAPPSAAPTKPARTRREAKAPAVP